MATTGLFTPKGAPRACVYFVFDVQPIRSGEPERMHCPHWLLALTIPFSRSDRAHTYSPVLMPGARRTVPDVQLSPESLLRLSEGRGGRSDGCVTLSDAQPSVNASDQAEFRRVNAPGSADPLDSTGHRRPNPRTPWQSGRDRGTPSGGMRRTTLRPSACHPGVRGSTGFPSPSPSARARLRGRALPVDLLDLPHVTNVRDRIIISRCCTAVTTP
jgi:hypothetical protein